MNGWALNKWAPSPPSCSEGCTTPDPLARVPRPPPWLRASPLAHAQPWVPVLRSRKGELAHAQGRVPVVRSRRSGAKLAVGAAHVEKRLGACAREATAAAQASCGPALRRTLRKPCATSDPALAHGARRRTRRCGSPARHHRPAPPGSCNVTRVTTCALRLCNLLRKGVHV